jgi:hypothetical protein
MTDIKPLATGQLVCWNVTTDHPKDVVVLAKEALDALCIDTELSDAGWRLVQFSNTGFNQLARRTGRSRWLAAWERTVDVVEVHDIDTIAIADSRAPQGAVVAALGAKVRNAFARQAD